MKIAVVGSDGYIASFLLERFQRRKYVDYVLKIDKSEHADLYLDLEEPKKFEYGTLEDIDYVVFTAAVSGPDMCADEYDRCWQINVTGTKYFIKQALEHKCKVLFFSSDAVFGDIAGFVYNETSETRAQTPYGKMKKAIEDEFKGEKFFKALRLSYVASAKDKFISYCLNCIKQQEEANVFHPFYRNCIVVSDVVDVVEWMGKHWEEYPSSFLNVAGIELVSRVRIADELDRIFNGQLKYVISTPDGSFYRNRPQITQMESLYLEKFDILKNENFTKKLQRELEDIIL